ncbi:Rrf2 family transcriptional regulator [Acinetobacter sichuanensis]|uniref:RrF2 family transcriptional regulator n=1 Tax=Acinetobacter sichuanensis TaxID=2136183 RepID=UPI00280FB544|nr:Rrf2 family transcriptional regulator [Acinetobacter sichuanensis]MDQ9021999.1 Rrf2 family transcriptional regulator [Acinetobacter sichuanensis]
MQLNKFTDYALRLVLYVSKPKDTPYTIAEIAKDLQVSENHLVKIVHFMARQNWLITTRGKGGGIRLDPNVYTCQLGAMVRILQGEAPIVECNTPPCVLRSRCGLKGILDDAVERFYQVLDQYTIADVVARSQGAAKSQHSPIELIQL